MKYDVRGPAGNVFCILGAAHRWARQCWPDNWQEKWAKIEEDAKSGDYDHALDVVEKAFNGSVKFIGRDGEEADDEV